MNRMTQPPRHSAAGILLALCLVIGAAVGVSQGQPSIGLLGGLAVGIALAAISVLVQRRR
jgi:hypothetical protein